MSGPDSHVFIRGRLLEELDDCVQRLLAASSVSKDPIMDHHPQLSRLTALLEASLCYGLRLERAFFWSDKASMWDIAEKLEKAYPPSKDAIEFIRSLDDVHTERGRGRAFLRMALNEALLSFYLESLVEAYPPVLSQIYYESGLLVQEREAHEFLSVIRSVEQIPFDLVMNDHHLDGSPQIVTASMVLRPLEPAQPLPGKPGEEEEAAQESGPTRIFNEIRRRFNSADDAETRERTKSLEEENAELKADLERLQREKHVYQEKLEESQRQQQELEREKSRDGDADESAVYSGKKEDDAPPPETAEEKAKREAYERDVARRVEAMAIPTVDDISGIVHRPPPSNQDKTGVTPPRKKKKKKKKAVVASIADELAPVIPDVDSDRPITESLNLPPVKADEAVNDGEPSQTPRTDSAVTTEEPAAPSAEPTSTESAVEGDGPAPDSEVKPDAVVATETSQGEEDTRTTSVDPQSVEETTEVVVEDKAPVEAADDPIALADQVADSVLGPAGQTDLDILIPSSNSSRDRDKNKSEEGASPRDTGASTSAVETSRGDEQVPRNAHSQEEASPTEASSPSAATEGDDAGERRQESRDVQEEKAEVVKADTPLEVQATQEPEPEPEPVPVVGEAEEDVPSDKNESVPDKKSDNAKPPVPQDPEQSPTEALLAAVKSGDVGKVESLIRSGVDPQWTDGNGWSLLHHAAVAGNGFVLLALLHHDVKPEAVKAPATPSRTGHGFLKSSPYAGVTPLHMAASLGKDDCVSLLVSRQDLLNVTDGEGRSALMLACKGAHATSAGALLKAGATVDVVDTARGRTALHYAVDAGSVECVKLLLMFGAKVTIEDKDLLTPHAMAMQNCEDEIAAEIAPLVPARSAASSSSRGPSPATGLRARHSSGGEPAQMPWPSGRDGASAATKTEPAPRAPRATHASADEIKTQPAATREAPPAIRERTESADASEFKAHFSGSLALHDEPPQAPEEAPLTRDNLLLKATDSGNRRRGDSLASDKNVASGAAGGDSESLLDMFETSSDLTNDGLRGRLNSIRSDFGGADETPVRRRATSSLVSGSEHSRTVYATEDDGLPPLLVGLDIREDHFGVPSAHDESDSMTAPAAMTSRRHTMGGSTSRKAETSGEFEPKRLQLHFQIPTRKPLSHQDYQCAGCGTPMGKGRFAKLFGSKPRFCEYTGLFYCPKCHKNELYAVPGRIIQHWDMELYKCSTRAIQFLSDIRSEPLFDLSVLNPGLYKKVPELQEVLELRTQLKYIHAFIETCKYKESLRLILKNRHYFMTSLHMFSLRDLYNVAEGQTSVFLQKVVANYVNHIKNECEPCRAKGHVCEICDNNHPIFSFDVIVATQCQNCKGFFHRTCYVKDRCPKCARLRRRMNEKLAKLGDSGTHTT